MKGIIKGLLMFCLVFTAVAFTHASNASATAPINKTYYVKGDVVNIRSGTGTNYATVAQVNYGTKLTAFEYAYNSKKEVWYHVTLPNGQKGWIASWLITTTAPAFSPVNAPLISQMPELPRGCEVTSLAMMLNYSGKKVSKMTLAYEVKEDPTPYRKVDGKVYFGNPNVGFVGNMYTFNKPGYGVYHKPVESLARQYLGDRIVNLSGKPFTEVKKQLDKRKPVWVIANSWFTKLPESQFTYFYTPQGPIKVTYREHSVLVTGYSGGYIYFNDPLSNQKNRKLRLSNFIAAWEQMGKQAISYN